jgi:hypothetical protein
MLCVVQDVEFNFDPTSLTLLSLLFLTTHGTKYVDYSLKLADRIKGNTFLSDFDVNATKATRPINKIRTHACHPRLMEAPCETLQKFFFFCHFHESLLFQQREFVLVVLVKIRVFDI